MALVSPGVEVTIIDESQYLSAGPASVPLVILATAENKANAAGTGIATGTTPNNANKLYRITSQRDLTTLFGTPFFYKTTNGTPLHGYELNEYGLLAAYSVLGVSNLCYVLRADIDLASLVGRTGRPSGEPDNGTYWLDVGTNRSTWGIFEFNASTGKFATKTPLVITDSEDLMDNSGQINQSIGNIGDYAIVFVTNSAGLASADDPHTYSTYWYKDLTNTWVPLGSPEWRKNWPTLQSNIMNLLTPLTVGSTFTINGVTVTVPSAPNNTITGLQGQINGADIPFVTAEIVDNRLKLYHALESSITIGYITPNPPSVVGSVVLDEIGIEEGEYNSPKVFFGTNAQQPRWRSTDIDPHPTGSVWVKTSAANVGLNLLVSQYDAASAIFVSKRCYVAINDWTITNFLDSTGGKNIAPGTLYAQYTDDGSYVGPIQLFRRFASGEMKLVGAYSSPEITSNASFKVQVSVPASNTLSSEYTVTLPAVPATLGSLDFVQAWTAANIPYTRAEVGPTGAIVLTHTEGGVIVLNDEGSTTSPITQAGFIIGTTPGAKWGPYKTVTQTGVAAPSGAAQFTIVSEGFNITSISITTPGTGYSAGDVLEVTAGNPFDSSYSLKITSVNGTGGITGVQLISGRATPQYSILLSNWEVIGFIPNDIAPTKYPSNNTYWYFSSANQADIMVNVGGQWKGYRNASFGSNGLAQSTGTPGLTDPSGPIFSADAPLTQTTGEPLEYGDLWIDTSPDALENYPVISRWEEVDGTDQWVTIDNTDQESERGIVFADARWAQNDTIDPIDDAIPSISVMLTSNYLDLDAPSGTMYPHGSLLFNTRRSSYNVKQFRRNYYNSKDFPEVILPQEKSTWITVSGLKNNGSPYMGRKAQRNLIVQALRSAITTNVEIREEDTYFNLIATPGYPELQSSMVTLNNDRNQTAYIVGDTPMRLKDDANEIFNWATNAALTSGTGEDGLVTRNTYMGLYYPSGITTDLTGTEVVIPSSHMILRTMLYNDTVAYPWFAPAGQRRGIVDNANNIGYIDKASGEFVVTKNRVALRDIEYTNFINPISYFTNIGILNYGNKNSFDSQSSLDRTNVARLVVYLRWQLQRALLPFVFEPNDTITRNEARGVVQTLLADILVKRGIYDYVVVCDETNNTPARIDRNELWVDIAIEPVKAAEFIYVPVRLLNTGEISGNR